MKGKYTYIVGIDEAGRGPLAGPVAVGAFVVTRTVLVTLPKLFKGARDSKKMTAGKREEIFAKIKEATRRGKAMACFAGTTARRARRGNINYCVVMQSAKVIDTKGLSWVIKDSIKKCLHKLKVDPKKTLVLLDGGIKAPAEFVYQKTIIKGDDKELVISLASIAAKVTRDKHMMLMTKKYPRYGFEKHKGYGTVIHRNAIRKHGASEIHRKTFLRNIV